MNMVSLEVAAPRLVVSPRLPPIGPVTLIITTKNRYADLHHTLSRLVKLGLGGVPLIVIDDGSSEEIFDFELLERFDRVSVYRSDISRGLVVNRNWMAAIAETEYVLSLDDDSCFRESPDFERIAEYMRRNPGVVALQFNNVEVKRNEVPVCALVPYSVQTYTGFGHLLKTREFLQLGGYREYFVHMCEERDFGQRAWKAGLRIDLYPDVVVDHQRTPVARNNSRNVHFLTRNTLIMAGLNLPLHQFCLRLGLIVPWGIFKAHRKDPALWMSIVRGAISGFGVVCSRFRERAPMSLKQFAAYRRMPVTK